MLYEMPIENIYIDESVEDKELAFKIASKFGISPKIISNKTLFKKILSSKESINEGKKNLLLTENKGEFIKKCPGTSYYTCCGYQIIHFAAFCTMDCSYCILQSYFHPPLLQFFLNYDRLFLELDEVFKQKKKKRFGTGEFTDSLIWEKYTGISKKLINKFKKQSSCVLEIKSKTVNIDSIKHLDHNKKTIFAWSLNTEKIIKSDERNTTSLLARLKAAKECESLGYKIAFHFDPIVVYEGCEGEYLKVIEKMFNYVSPKNIVYISIGTFRFMPSLKNIIEERFPNSKIPYGEFIMGLDSKMRYFKPIRIRVYKKIIDKIRSIAPDVTLYFCMEDDEVWQKSMGFLPKEKGGLVKMLDDSVVKHCELKT